MKHFVVGLAAILLLALPPAVLGQDSPYSTTQCPVPEGFRGFPIIVRPPEGVEADSAYLVQIANMIGGHMQDVPRREYRSEIMATVGGDGRLRQNRVSRPSDDPSFDRMLLRSVRAAFEDSSILAYPSRPSPDPLVLHVLFGSEPAASEPGFRRLSVQARTPTLARPRLQLTRPVETTPSAPRGEVVLMVAFNGDSTARAQSVLVATSSDLIPLARSLAEQLDFTPGQSDCKLINYVEPVRFTFTGDRVRAELVQ